MSELSLNTLLEASVFISDASTCSALKFPVETTGPRAAPAPLRAPWGHSRAQRPLILQRDWLLGVAFLFSSPKSKKV